MEPNRVFISNNNIITKDYSITFNNDGTKVDIEKVWHTAKGDAIPFSQVTHGHWSNIYWYHRYIFEMAKIGEVQRFKAKDAMDTAVEQINKSFNGIIKDWQPVYEHEKLWFQHTNTRKILIEKHV